MKVEASMENPIKWGPPKDHGTAEMFRIICGDEQVLIKREMVQIRHKYSPSTIEQQIKVTRVVKKVNK